ncbi:MAG TPA: HEAT repeat domain-containing protein [Ktedonobacteraceae bacterium]
MDNDELKQLLDNFSKLKYRETKLRYDTGLSGAQVLFCEFGQKGTDGPGHTNYCIVKIGKLRWVQEELKFFNSDFKREQERKPNLANLVTQVLDVAYDGERAALAYSVSRIHDVAPLVGALGPQGHSYLSDDQVREQIQILVSKLGEWYLEGGNFFNGVSLPPHELLQKMLHKWRVDDIKDRLGKALPAGWDQESLRFHLGESKALWNPLPHLWKEAWLRTGVDYRISYPLGRIHGDLHTGNILCLKKPPVDGGSALVPFGLTEGEGTPVSALPTIIDFGQTDEAGVPLFDFAYLEFDILQNLLSSREADYDQQWSELLSHSMTALLPAEGLETKFGQVRKAWRFIRPIREEVSRLLKKVEEQQNPTMRLDYEITWWCATVAVGLNYARKVEADQPRPPWERQAALFYAAHGLERVYAQLPMPAKFPQDLIPYIKWERPAQLGTGAPQVSAPAISPRPPLNLAEQKQKYLQLAQQSELDRVNLSMFAAPQQTMADVAQIELSEVFTWPKVSLSTSRAEIMEWQGASFWQNGSAHLDTMDLETQLAEPMAVLKDLREMLKSSAHLVLLGGVGSGKTTLLRYLHLQLAAQNADFLRQLPELSAFIPIRIDLRDYALTYNYLSLRDFLDEHFKKKYADIDCEALLQGDGKVLFLFDNLDAIVTDTKRAEFAQHLSVFLLNKTAKGNLQATSPHRSIVTSRVVDFTPQNFNRYTICTLAAFTRESEIAECVRRWCDAYQRLDSTVDAAELAERALRKITRRDKSLAKLTTNPLLLTIFITTFLQEKEQIFSRFQYLQDCVQALLHIWPGARDAQLPDTMDDLHQKLQALAFWMHDTFKGKPLSEDEITNQIKRQIHESVDEAEKTDQATQYLSLATQVTDVLLVYDQQYYGFLFPALKEYLVAEELVERSNRGEVEIFIREKVRDPHWREIIRLALSMLISRGGEGEARNLIYNTILRSDLPEQHSPYRLWLAGRCLVDSAQQGQVKLQNEIIDKIVEKYLSSPSEWVRAHFSDVLRAWSDAPGAEEARKTLRAVLAHEDISLIGDNWDKKVGRRYNDLPRDNPSVEQKQLGFHIMTLLYLLYAREDILNWIQQVREDLKSSKEQKVRVMAANTLGILGRDHPQEVRAALLEAFSDSSWQVWSAAALALGSLISVDTNIISDLHLIFTQDGKTIQEKEAAIVALGQSSHVDPQSLRAILLYLLQVLEPGAAPPGSSNGNAGDPQLPLLSQLLLAETPSPAIRRSSVLAVGQIARKQPGDISKISSYKQIFEYLLKAISDEDSSVRQAAAIALGCLGKNYWEVQHEEIIHALQVARSDGYLPVTETAIRALEYLGEYPMPMPVEAFLI